MRVQNPTTGVAKGGRTAETYTINTAGLCSSRVPNMGLLRISPHPDSILPAIHEITCKHTHTHTHTHTQTLEKARESKQISNVHVN
jgi:hypothetical protein